MNTRLERAERFINILEGREIRIDDLVALYNDTHNNEIILRALIQYILNNLSQFQNINDISNITLVARNYVRMEREYNSVIRGAHINYVNSSRINNSPYNLLLSIPTVFSNNNLVGDTGYAEYLDYLDDQDNLDNSLQEYSPPTSGLSTFDIDVINNAPLKMPPEDTKCSICTNRYYDDNPNMLQFSCTHYFHKQCIIPWIRINNKCPMCRKKPMALLETIPEEHYSERDSDTDSDIEIVSDTDSDIAYCNIILS